MAARVETFESFRPPDTDLEAQIVRLRELRAERGSRNPEMPDLSLERQTLAEKNDSLWEAAKEKIKAAFDFLIVRPVEWLGRQITEHPIRTILIALAAFAIWYYSAPISAGLAALKEKGIEISSGMLEKGLDIDPTQVDGFDQLMGS